MADESQGALSLDELHEMAALAQELGDDDAELEAREAIDAFVVADVRRWWVASLPQTANEAPQQEKRRV